jgi:hypothetical protein
LNILLTNLSQKAAATTILNGSGKKGKRYPQPPYGSVPKTLLFGTAEKQPVLDCQKPRSKLKQLMKVFGPHVVPDISCIAENQ